MVQMLLTGVMLLVALYIGFCIGYSSAAEELELRSEPESSNAPTFTYCMNKDIKEAFKVSEGCLPLWAIDDNIDVQISPEMKIVVHKENGYNVVARGSDYLIRDADGDFFCCPDTMFEASYQKIEA